MTTQGKAKRCAGRHMKPIIKKKKKTADKKSNRDAAADKAEHAARDKAIEDGKSAMRADYHRSMRGMASCVASEYRDAIARGEKPDLQDMITQDADGCYWTTYTHAHLQCMIASDNWLAAEDADAQPGENLTDTLRTYTFYAVEADIRAYLPDDLEKTDE